MFAHQDRLNPCVLEYAGSEEIVELRYGDFLVLRNQSGTILILETLGSSYFWNRERATLRWRLIEGDVVDGGILHCFIRYQSRRTGWGRYTLRKQVGSSMIVLANITLEWSYSTKRSLWIYLPQGIEYALRLDPQSRQRGVNENKSLSLTVGSFPPTRTEGI